MGLTLVLVAIIGLLIGGISVWLILKPNADKLITEKDQKLNELKVELKYEQERSVSLMADLSTINKDLKFERKKFLEASVKNSTLKAKLESFSEKLTEQKEEVKKIQEQFSSRFKNLANDIFEEKSKKFTDQNKLNIHEILKPLGEKISRFENKVDQSNKESIERNASLKEQILGLKELNIKITKEAENLTNALKADNKLQGNWGEIQLESILQSAGLQKEVHYFKEKNMKSESNDNLRPDFIINLPDQKNLVIDSKVSLVAFSNYFSTDDEEKKAGFLSAHILSIQNHIKNLSSKNYQSLHGINPPDYVLLFLANEGALVAALQNNLDLYDFALNRNIVLVANTTLMATLKTISYIWKHDLQNRNALEIARQAGLLYDKFVSFTEDLTKLGAQLQISKNTYQEAMKKLYDGKDNLVRKTERLKALGAKSSKQLDSQLMDKSDLPD